MAAPADSLPVDGRIIAYRMLRWLVVVSLLSFAVKFFLFDTYRIENDQMSPTLIKGDQVIVFKLFSQWPFSAYFLPRHKSPVVAMTPLLFRSPLCLRVAARSSDSVSVSHGAVRVPSFPSLKFYAIPHPSDVVPPDYSPRDSMASYTLPCIGDTLTLDSLSIRNFFFAVSLIRQENPQMQYTVRPVLYVDGKAVPGYVFKDFHLYKGSIDSVPEKFAFDWFFWDRANDYIVHAFSGKETVLSFSLVNETGPVFQYVVTQSCIFLIADDWMKGCDSRYFGPVVAKSIKGRVICVLWSLGQSNEGNLFFRIERLFKIIS
jgi:hypothetical protein